MGACWPWFERLRGPKEGGLSELSDSLSTTFVNKDKKVRRILRERFRGRG
jgi:hypothetical protein